jgi:hypothetical protein
MKMPEHLHGKHHDTARGRTSREKEDHLFENRDSPLSEPEAVQDNEGEKEQTQSIREPDKDIQPSEDPGEEYAEERPALAAAYQQETSITKKSMVRLL